MEYSPDTDTGIATVEEQVVESAPEMGQTESVEPFYSYQDETGQKTDFTTPDELNRYMRDGYLRHSDYTRKTQEISEQRKAFEQERNDFNQQMKEFREREARVKKADEFLRGMPQDTYQQLVSGIKSGGRSQANNEEMEALRSQISEQQEQLQSYMQAQEDARRRNEAYEIMSKEYPDFDREMADGLINSLREAGPGNEMKTFLEFAYYANKGKTLPSQQHAQKVAEKKSGAKIPISGAKKSGAPQQQAVYSSEEEAYEALMNDIGE
jgi:hypothetical protein